VYSHITSTRGYTTSTGERARRGIKLKAIGDIGNQGETTTDLPEEEASIDSNWRR
jgi:hypothetical protein